MRTLLLIEDDIDIRLLLEEALTMEGYTVLSACNGHEGTTLLEKNTENISLILLDLMMPVMNGWEFLTWIDEKGFSHRFPIIIMSGAGTKAEQTARASRCKLLPKPLNLDKLLDLVEQNSGMSHA